MAHGNKNQFFYRQDTPLSLELISRQSSFIGAIPALLAQPTSLTLSTTEFIIVIKKPGPEGTA